MDDEKMIELPFAITQQSDNTFTTSDIAAFTNWITRRGGTLSGDVVTFRDNSTLTINGNNIIADDKEALAICEAIVYQQNSTPAEAAALDKAYRRLDGLREYFRKKDAGEL
jgi:hypothetical protein